MTTPSVAPEPVTTAPRPRPTPRWAWVITGLLVIFQIINFADKAVLGLVAGPAMRDLQLTAGEFGRIGSAFFLLFAVSSIAVGFIAGKVSTRWILLVMGVSWAVIQFPILLGGGAAVLLVGRILLGAAEGPATPISLQHVHGWFPAAERGLPSSLVAVGSTLGPVIAAPILAAIIASPTWGWRWAFGFLGIVGVVWSLLWLLLGRDGSFSHTAARKDADSAPAEAQPQLDPDELAAATSIAPHSDLLGVVPIGRVIGSRMFLVAIFAGAGCFWTQGFLTTWSPKYLGAVVSLSPEMIGLVSTFPWLIGAGVLLVLGYASRVLMRRGVTVRWALGALFAGTLLCAGACFLILPHVGGWLAVAVMTVGAGMAMTFPLAPTAVAFSVGSRQRAAVMATLTGFASIGGVIAPTMVGMLMDRAGYAPAPKGMAETAEMAARLASGMNSAFLLIGVYLLVVGGLSLLLLNPDRTAQRLQAKFRW